MGTVGRCMRSVARVERFRLRGAVLIEPLKHLADAGLCKTDGTVCGTVVQVECVFILADRVPAGEDDISYVAGAFIRLEGSKDPLVSASDTGLW